MGDGDGELLREVLRELGELGARVEGLQRSQEAIQDDARQARDTSNRVATILEEQNIVVRMGEQRHELRALIADLREDVVAANTRLKQELDAAVKGLTGDLAALGARVTALEAERNKVVGVAGFFSWLARVAPWLVAAIAAFAAGLGLRGGHH